MVDSQDSLADQFWESWCILEDQYLGIPLKVSGNLSNPPWGTPWLRVWNANCFSADLCPLFNHLFKLLREIENPSDVPPPPSSLSTVSPLKIHQFSSRSPRQQKSRKLIPKLQNTYPEIVKKNSGCEQMFL